MIKVLFVCLGNICRSPMAEAVFAHKVKQAGLEDRIAADSAGTGDWHMGNPPHRGTRAMLEEHEIEYTHAARMITRADYDEFDLILTMDDENLRAVNLRCKGKAQVRRFLDFAPDCGYTEVPDPYYAGNFDLTYHLADQAAEGLLAHLRKEHAI
jgi:protein-tyrosine phosphatase